MTLNEVSNGRAELPYGTGYSSAYIVGKNSATLKPVKEDAESDTKLFANSQQKIK